MPTGLHQYSPEMTD